MRRQLWRVETKPGASPPWKEMVIAMQRIADREAAYVREVLESQFRTSAGSRMTQRLEQLFAERFESRFAISFNNGTATMHAALVAAGVGPGDEVIVPPLTMASTTFAVLHAGAVPVFADVDPHLWTIDPASIAGAITERTKAIITVSIYGLSPDMAPIMELARQHNLFVLEDDAECFLGYYQGQVVGSIGHASSFSFQSTKHLTSGEGGMIVTNDEKLANEIRRFGSLGYAAVAAGAGKGKITRQTIQSPDYARHASIGYNYRLPELCAAVALAQTERMDELVAVRLNAAACYAGALAGCGWLTPQAVPAGYIHSYWTYVLKLEPAKGISWYQFRDKYLELGGDGIYAAWLLTYHEPAFRGQRFGPQQWQTLEKGLCPVAESLQPHLLQFKTDYYDPSEAEQQAAVLAKTIAHFN
jgi:perosamine synthetase